MGVMENERARAYERAKNHIKLKLTDFERV